MKVNRRLRNVKGADMKIFQTPSYDRFCLFEMERKSKDFRGMDDNVAYKNKQIDNVEISNEGRRALREKLREVKPKVEEPIGYELTIQDTNEVEWEHYTSMREYSGLTLKDGKYNLEDVMKSMMDAYETRYGQLSLNNFQNDIELFSGSQTVSSISPPFLYDLKSVYPSFRTI